jgi:hypothetical protein
MYFLIIKTVSIIYIFFKLTIHFLFINNYIVKTKIVKINLYELYLKLKSILKLFLCTKRKNLKDILNSYLKYTWFIIKNKV